MFPCIAMARIGESDSVRLPYNKAMTPSQRALRIVKDAVIMNREGSISHEAREIAGKLDVLAQTLLIEPSVLASEADTGSDPPPQEGC